MFNKLYDWLLVGIAKLMESLYRLRDAATDRHLRGLDRKKDEHNR